MDSNEPATGLVRQDSTLRMSLGGVMQSKSQACASGRRDSGRLRIPRTRTGDFRPATLPALYQRGYSEETQIGSSWRFGSLPALSCSRLLSRLAFGRALNAVKNALQKMGFSSSQDSQRVATGLIEQ